MCCKWLPLAHRHTTHWSFHVKLQQVNFRESPWKLLFKSPSQCNDYTIAGFIPEHAPQVKINSTDSHLAHKKAINPHYGDQKSPLNNAKVVCGVESCTLLLKQGKVSLLIGLVLKKLVSECMQYISVNSQYEYNKNEQNNLCCTHSTPDTKVNIMQQHFADGQRNFYRPIPVRLRVNISTKMKHQCGV